MDRTDKPLVTVSFKLGAEAKGRIEEVLDPVARIAYLENLDPESRAVMLGASRVVLTLAPHQEFSPTEERLLENVSFMQLL